MEQERIIQIENILTEARFQFAMKCLYRFNRIKPKSNIAFSPHSIYEGLLMVYFLSSGAIEQRLKHILYLSDVIKYELIDYYLSRRASELQSKNNASAASSDYGDESRCWIKTTNFKFNLLPLKYIFKTGLEVFDPDNTSTEKIVRINMTIKNSLKNHFLNPVKLSAEKVRDDMELVLMTVSRMNVQKFQISTTCQSNASNVLNLFDKRKNNSFFSRKLKAHVTEYFYTKQKTSLFVFLPDSIISGDFKTRNIPSVNYVCNWIERISTEKKICKLRNLLDSDTPSGDVTNYTLNPIFYLERDMPMRALLRDLGIEELLEPDAINLDSFFVNDDSVHFGNAVHRISVNVTEKDTEACAANVIYTGQKTSHGREHKSLNYNFPFVWLIYDKQRQNVLFAGAFNKFKRRRSSTL